MFNNLWTNNISLNLSIFSFTNIEATRIITLSFKSSMEISWFQWSQVSKHPDWKPYVNAWFTRFKVSVNLQFLLFFMFVTPGHRGDQLKNNLDWKKNRYLASCSLGEKWRSRHLVLWSLGTLTGQQRFYGTGTGYAKGKMLSPFKCPTWGRLHCWFRLKLLRVCCITLFLVRLGYSWL
jgi:hypothetical protein